MEKERCFVIMPISDQGDYPEGHFTRVYEQIIKPAIEESGYSAYRVDDNKISDSIIGNIFEAIQECPMAVCDLSNRNPNVLYELGLRQAYDKPVVLIQDERTERIFDISGINTVSYNSNRLYENVLDAREKIKEAIVATKEGKRQTMVKVVQAKSAQISIEPLSNEAVFQVAIAEIKDQLDKILSAQEKSIQKNSVSEKTIKGGFQRLHIVATCDEINSDKMTQVQAAIEKKLKAASIEYEVGTITQKSITIITKGLVIFGGAVVINHIKEAFNENGISNVKISKEVEYIPTN